MIANVVKKHYIRRLEILVSSVKPNDPGLSNGHVSKMCAIDSIFYIPLFFIHGF
jgi:hypothetical protein